MTCKILRLLVNTLPADEKHSLLNRENLTQTIQVHLSMKQKKILQIFCSFIKSTLNFEHFQTKMTLIAYRFPELRTPKHMVR